MKKLTYLAVVMTLGACGNTTPSERVACEKAPTERSITFVDRCTGATKQGVFVQSLSETSILVISDNHAFLVPDSREAYDMGMPNLRDDPSRCPHLKLTNTTETK